MSSGAPAARAAGPGERKDDPSPANKRPARIRRWVALAFFLGVVAKYWLIGN